MMLTRGPEKDDEITLVAKPDMQFAGFVAEPWRTIYGDI